MSDNVKSGLFNVLRRWTLVISKQVEADIKTYLQLLLDPSNALSLSLFQPIIVWFGCLSPSPPHQSSLSLLCCPLSSFSNSSPVGVIFLLPSHTHRSVFLLLAFLIFLFYPVIPLLPQLPTPLPLSVSCLPVVSSATPSILFFFLEFIPGWLACCELSFWQPINYFTQTREQVGDFCIFDTFFLQNIYIRFKKPEHCVKPASRFNHIRDIWKSYCICSNMLGESWKQCNEKLQKVMATRAAFGAPFS